MTLKTAFLNLRCFLEGIEVPVVSAQVTAQTNRTATASIQLVPTPMAHRIMARTKVDLFFHDMYAYQEVARSRVAAGGEGGGQISWRREIMPATPETPADAASRQAEGSASGVIQGQNLNVPEDLLRYRLLFTGEVMGFSYVKQAGNRGVMLQCAGCSNYWDLVAADRRGSVLFGGGPAGGGQNDKFSNIVNSPFWDLLRGSTGEVWDKLNSPPTMFPNLKGFSAGIIHAMEALFGVYLRVKDGAPIVVRGANQFLALASLRLKLMQQVGVAGGGDSPLKLMRSRGFGGIFQPALRGMPRYFTFRQLLEALMPYTFMEHTPILAPRYTPPTGYYANLSGWGGFDTGFIRNSPTWAWVARVADRIRAGCQLIQENDLADIREREREEGSASADEFDDTVEVIKRYAAQFKRLATSIKNGTTRDAPGTYVYVKTDPDTGAQNIYATGHSEFATIDAMTEDQREEAGYEKVRRVPDEALQRLERVAGWASSIYDKAGELETALPGRLPTHYDDRIGQLLSDISMLATQIANYNMPPPSRGDEDSDSDPGRLYCDVLRPDVWFVAPPRSNVIFPDHTVSLSFGRMFSQEATRLLVRVYDKWLGSNPFFDQWWIAPVAPGLFRDRPIGRSGATIIRSRIKRDLMDHELAGGIIPIFHSMSDREMLLGKNLLGYGAQPQGLQDATQTARRNRYFQQVTNFLLFKTRFSARSLTLECRFNPYLIMGFPAAIIDVPTDQVQTEVNQLLLNEARKALEGLGETEAGFVLELLRNRCGTHFLAMIQQIVHVVNATGENCGTSVVMNYAREHNEKIEYMGQDIVRMADEAAKRDPHTRTVRQRTAEQERLLESLRRLEYILRGYRDLLGGIGQDNLLGSEHFYDPRLSGVPQTVEVNGAQVGGTYRDVWERVTEEISKLENMGTDVSVTLRTPPTKTSYVFVLKGTKIFVRQGTPPEPGAEPSEGYQAGQYGPNGGEIIEATDVTKEYRNRMRRSNVSGLSAQEVALMRAATEQYEADLAARREALRRQEEAVAAGTMTAAQMADDVEHTNMLQERVNSNRRTLAQYDAGWRYTPVTLPLLNSPKTGRNTPFTTITTDKVGVPVDVREIPELVGIIGTTDVTSTPVYLQVFRIVEDMTNVSGSVIDLAAEDIIRPPWYSADWSNRLVGGAVYLPLFGVGSIVDPIAIMKPESINIFGQPSSITDSIQRIRQEIFYEDTGEGDTPVMAGILEGASIENAIDFLVHTYSVTKLGGFDVESLIHNYTWRPIATMFDMYGSGDLQLDQDGKLAVAGVEGFHSRAFGPYSNFFGLIPFTDIQSLLGVEEDDAATAARLDIRGRRYAIIQAYRLELLRLRGCSYG